MAARGIRQHANSKFLWGTPQTLSYKPTKFQPICSAGPFLAKIPILSAHPIRKFKTIFSDIIDYVKNNLNIHRKIITTAERDMRLTEKYIRENIDETENAGNYFPVRYKIPLMDQGNIFFNNLQKLVVFLSGQGWFRHSSSADGPFAEFPIGKHHSEIITMPSWCKISTLPTSDGGFLWSLCFLESR